MTAPNETRRAQIRRGAAKWREAQRAAGLTAKTLWLHPDDWPAVLRLMAELAARRDRKLAISAPASRSHEDGDS